MPLPFSRRALQTAPSFSRDFAGLKTLDHGVGPAITFTRASNATFFDASGTLQTAANDTPRFDHSGGSSLGLLIEEARTNSIRNSQAGGAVAGTPGTPPTNWTISGTANGITGEIVATGTENGLAYLDYKVSGTPTATSGHNVVFESGTQIVAANGQSWTASAFVKLIAGSFNNVNVRVYASGRDAGGAQVSGQIAGPVITPTSAALSSQRYPATLAISSASVERILSFVNIAYTSGNPIDLTLRIAAPQLEQGAFATSYIPTTSAAATRAADSAVVTPIASFYNQAEGTLFAEARENGVSALYGAASLDTNTSDNRIDLRRADAGTLSSIATNGGANQATLFRSLANAAQTYRLIAAYATNDIVAVLNGGAATTDTSATLPTLTHFRIGALASVAPATGQAFFINGHIRRIAYWPRRLSNSLLQQLTT
jgi:hypothetical protein